MSRDSYLLVSHKGNTYFTDSRYTEEAALYLKGKIRIEEIGGSVFKSASENCQKLKISSLGFEEGNISHLEFKQIKRALPKRVRLFPTCGIVEELRKIKSPIELLKIKKAAQITIGAFEFIKRFIRPGIREIEVAAELERFIRYKGGQGASFNIIVASGPNSSYPHHITSGRKLKNNELVLIDAGTEVDSYKSDLTRVFFLGKINALARRIYDIVLRANNLAIAKIRPEVAISAIDAASRKYIAACGFGKYFVHSLGHGVGLQVHEAPRICAKTTEKLKAGMAITIEPAIYLPGKFGIRIEDMVHVTKTGCEVLSGSLHK